MKGFMKDGKFRPTGTKQKSALKKKDIGTNNPFKGMKIAYKKHIEEKKKKESVGDIIDAETEERLEKLDNDEDSYDDFLDQAGDSDKLVEDYGLARILKETDEIAYRVGFTEWQDMELNNLEDEINREAVESAEEELEEHEEDSNYDLRLESLISTKEDEIRQDKEDELDEGEYDDYLDEVGGSANIGSYSRVLKEIDNVAYRTGMNDWIDGERERIRDEVKDEIDEDASLKSGEFEL